jgi:2,3-bisphosphoglycerate-independent phosphoglycerate mutase
MDRDRRWDRTERAWRAFVRGEGRPADTARQGIETAYEMGETDEFIAPTVIDGRARMAPGDYAISFNFRKDRPRQMVKALAVAEFEDFDRGDFEPLDVTCMMEYEPRYRLPFAFDHEKPAMTLSKVLSDANLRQFHCAETEKYAHVTYFFNGGRREPLPGEEHHLIPSPKVATYDLKPEMSAPQVADAVVEAIAAEEHAFIVVNFANGDMVGHTGVWEAAIAAVETLDREVGRVLDTAVAHDYSVILTADHGNCDEMVDPATDEPHTQHTVYPVPLLVIDQVDWKLSTQGGLSNIAPTVLHLMGLTHPPEMKSRTLLLQPLR